MVVGGAGGADVVITTPLNMASLITIVGIQGTQVVADRSRSRMVIAMLLMSLGIWATGVLGVGENANVSNPARGKFLDYLLIVHFSLLPVILTLPGMDMRSAMFIAVGGIASAVATIGYATQETGSNVRHALHYGSRGLSVALMAMVMTMGGMVGKGLVGFIEVLYAFAYIYFKPVDANSEETGASIAGMDGLKDAYRDVTGIDPDAEPEPVEDPDSCAPMCVDGNTPDACYAHNAMVDRLHKIQSKNKEAGIPEFHGMTLKQRRCLRAHPPGSRCIYCDGHGCMRGPKRGVQCHESADDLYKKFSKIEVESKRLQESGMGVLTFDEQLESMESY